ncbi:T cell receptor alpha chain MC.7.G5-like [Pteronotus mesoamericanus]|uniref:T cell receptor alpha chain MC.7.G5-like n=1 Tax=Pteronotus mesoamericanus TaxID=1884717 RepID=UPI0023EDCE0F|nr:T cell receptor alpha chain MC.7.G5-like [Pteronotus parnellii mesoamericanus]
MNSAPGLVTVVLLVLGQTRGDSVTQTEGQVILLKGDSLTLNCSYEAPGYPTLFWYVQYPGEGLQLLLRATRADEKGSNKGFEATYRKKPNSFHLEKASVQESDSATYFCALNDTVTESWGRPRWGPGTGVSTADRGRRRRPDPELRDGPTWVFLGLFYQSGNCLVCRSVYRVQWFRQNPGGGLSSLFHLTSESKQVGRLSSTIHSKDLYSTLHITTSQLEDSATYFCAAEAQRSQVMCSLNPNCSWACSSTPSMRQAC